jgi:membrane-associated phospholipid phosphatase
VTTHLQEKFRTWRLITARSATLVISASALLACDPETTDPTPPANDQIPGAVSIAAPGWHEQARALIAQNRLSPLATARILGAVAVAQYDAINEADDYGGTDSVLPSQGFGPGGRSRYELERGAVAGASWLVLAHLFPDAAGALEQRVDSESKTIDHQPHPQFQRGLGVGVQAANRMIARLRADHFTDPWTGTIPTGPGKWINNGPPAGATFGQVTPYLLLSGSQFRAPVPPAFNGAAFMADLNEVKTVSATRTAEQLASALSWNYGTGTYTPVGYWNQVANNFITANRLNERGAVHVLALTHAAMMDALIGCWDSKYFHWYIRPYQVETAITLPIGAPNHPSYPSGHSCVSTAAATVLGDFFPTEAAQLRSQVTQAGLSRIYGGIHYRFDITTGEKLGRSVAEWAINQDKTAGLLSIVY